MGWGGVGWDGLKRGRRKGKGGKRFFVGCEFSLG